MQVYYDVGNSTDKGYDIYKEIRMLKGRSPINADNNHIHHVLVEAGLNHNRATLLLIFINLLFVAAAYLFQKADQSILFFGMLLSGLAMSQLPSLLFRRKQTKSIF